MSLIVRMRRRDGSVLRYPDGRAVEPMPLKSAMLVHDQVAPGEALHWEQVTPDSADARKVVRSDGTTYVSSLAAARRAAADAKAAS